MSWPLLILRSNDLQIHLPQWSSEFPMYQVMEEANTYIGTFSLDSANTHIDKFSHNSDSTGQKLDTLSSNPSKQDEKDKTADKHKIAKENLSPKRKLMLQTFFQTLKVWISGYNMIEKLYVHTRLFWIQL